MIELHPQIIEKDGKKEFTVLPYDEFVRVQEELEDYEDLRQLREAQEHDKEAPAITLAELKKDLGEQ
ncbi:MAG: type II toxin-antitoxin system Phd/YefM family antitoxin [Pseudomonadota bacterium]|nr:type II toxin-antitoxin system Phd/YefM family antitoxin [Gammaproteobacteria bacterium]MDQ3582120.1 type II toxin-antitoxin system Phd/YefM family antitoxin [Pseudomonadota bacterium]